MLPGVGLYLDGGFGVGKTHLLASAYYRIPAPKAFAAFGELTQLAGVFGFVECIDLLAGYTAVCIDEFELDDPGNTTLISRLLSSLVERGVSVAATSNTLPEQLGEGRFAAQDFLREINTLASIFTTVRIEGPDYRHRDLPPAPLPLSDEEVTVRAADVTGATLDDFDALCAHLATMHPSRYLALIEGAGRLAATGYPVLIGSSRKGFIGRLTGVKEPGRRDPASVWLAVEAARLGASILRVHDVAGTRQALAVWAAMR